MSSAVATRYATALADVALEQGSGEAVRRDLASFTGIFYSSADLRNFLESPAIGPEAKHGAIEALAAKASLGAAVVNFARLLVDHHRTELLREVEQAFGEVMNQRLGIAEAQISSARELSAAEKKELTEVLERRTGKKIDARFHEDKALVGGAVVRIGSKIYDGSVREQLARLREQLERE